MKLTRPALCLALVASVTAAGAAGAATKPKPKPVCNLLVDPAGDAKDTFLQEGVMPSSEDAVDIVSADVAADAKTLETVIRVKKLATSSSTAPGGLHWKFFFNVGEDKIYTQAIAATGGSPTFVFGTIDATAGTSKKLGDATGVLDTAKSEVRIWLPLSALPNPPKPGAKINTLEPNAGRYYSAGVSLSDPTDSATSSKSYTVGALSCVKVGA